MSDQNKKGFNTHRLLRAIDNNTLLSKLPKREQGQETDIMLPYQELCGRHDEFPELIQNTTTVLEHCHIDFDFSQTTPNNQKSFTQNEASDYQSLQKLTYGYL